MTYSTQLSRLRARIPIAFLLLFTTSLQAQINTSKPVGILEGSSSVLSDGAVSYTVPIKSPDGVTGFQPSLSLVYNSRSNDGIAGWGWGLNGLSNITRGNTTYFYNYLVAPIKMNANDNFYLDGQLLMPVSGSNGGDGTEYRTESDNYTKVQSFGGSNGDPQWWRVTSKDGSVMEYGVADYDNDKLKANGNLVWFISNAKDVSNNTITYTYNNWGTEVFLYSVNYANVSIVFNYTYKENNNYSFVNGVGLSNSRLLNMITVNVGGARQVDYKLTHTQKIKRHYLETVELVGTDNSSSVLTNFNYGNPDNEEAISLYNGYYQNSFGNVTLSPGDYDGDGKTDLVVAERTGNVNGDGTGIESTTSSAYNVITNVGVRPNGYIEPSQYELTHTYAPTTYMRADEFTSPFSYYSTDYRGTGLDGILRPSKIFHRFQDSRGDWHDDGMNYTDAINIEDFTKSGGSMSVNSNSIPLPFSYSTWATYNYYLKESNSFIQGDFNGDSKTDVISILGYIYQSGENIERRFNVFMGWYIYRRTPIYDYNYKGFLTNIDNGEINSEILGIDNVFKDAQAIYPIDFDGDGKQELMVFKKYSYLVYAIEGLPASTGYSYQAVLKLSGSNIAYTNFKRVLSGDFNGDRKTDFIGISTSQYATIWYSTGTSYASGTFQLDRTPDFSTVWFDFFTTGDFNGDGITDLFHYYNYPITVGGTTSYYPKQSVHYFKGMYYSPSSTSTGEDVVCSYDPIPYDNYTILEIYPQYCWNPDMGYVDAWRIEYTYTSPEWVYPLFTKSAGYHSGMVANMVYGSPPEIGDFNGDGKTEIIQSTGGGNYVLVDPFGYDKNSSILQSVTDGYGNTTSFDYRTLAEKSVYNLYANTGDVSLYYPLNLMPLSMKVAAQKTEPNGIGGTTTSKYYYRDAVLDRHKGFLGFRKSRVITNNEHNVLDEAEVNTQYRVMVPFKSTTSFSDPAGTYEDLVSSTQTTTNILGVPNGSTRYYAFNKFKAQTASTMNVDELSGAAVKKDYTYDANDNPTQVIAKTGYRSGNDVIPIETTTTNTTYGQTGKALVAIFPTRVSITNERNGISATKVTTSSYTSDRGLLSSQVSWEGTALATTVNYTHNSFGNVTQTQTLVPNRPAVTATSTFDNDQRYIVSTTVTCDNKTRTSSTATHPFWGSILSKTDGDGSAGSLTTTYEYDAMGRLKKTNTPFGHQIQESYVWDVSGDQAFYKLIDYPDVVGADQKIWYDKKGRIIKTKTLGWNGNYISQVKTYDSWGRDKTSTIPYYDGEPILTNTNNYDRVHRLASVATPSGTTTISYNYPGSGQSLVTEVNAAGQTSSKKTDATGLTLEVSDHGGTVSHTYDARNNLLTTVVNGITVVNNTYDQYGRKTQSVEANAGTVAYEYDESDNITKVTDANNKVTTMTYDGLNRLINRNNPEGNTVFEYYNTPNNQALKKVYNNNYSQELVYDNYRRLVTKMEAITGEGNFNTVFEYNTADKISATIYPDGTRVENLYNNAGLLSTVQSNGAVLFNAVDYDGQGHAKQYTLVNGLQSTDTYSQGLPTRFNTPGIQDLQFTFDNSTGNLQSRTDALKGLSETFTYDNLNRLTSATVNNVQQFSITYDGNSSQSNGNIATKSDIGTYTYLNAKPHAVGFISPLTNSALAVEPAATISYSSFQRPLQIVKSSSTLDLFYGTDDERVKTVQNVGGLVDTKLFLGSYEKQTRNNGTLNHIVYVAGGNGLCAMIVNGVPHAVYADYLGSILTITNTSGAVVAAQNFDAWGRRRNVNDWTFNNTGEGSLPAWLYRGYTGHEHLPAFGLINMNARLYDYYNGRMLASDNITSGEWGTQGFNKYSYANNNPMKYVDPDGDNPLVVAMIIGFVMGAYTGGTIANQGEMNPFKWDYQNGKTWGYMAGGGVLGGLSGGMGASIAQGGGFMAQTIGMMSSSFMFSTGMAAITDFGMSPSISFGIASYDLGTNTWGYLGKKGNKWYQDMFYTFGALANLQDLVNGFWSKDYEYQYELDKKEANVGHANIREVNTTPATAGAPAPTNPVKISVANLNTVQTKHGGILGAIEYAWKANFRKYSGGPEHWLLVPEKGWPRIPLKLNSKIVDWMYNNLAKSKGLWGVGKTRFGLNFGCVSYAARALWTAGVPTIPVINYLGPRILWIQLAIRQVGITSSPILNSLPK